MDFFLYDIHFTYWIFINRIARFVNDWEYVAVKLWLNGLNLQPYDIKIVGISNLRLLKI